ncbi:MAG: conjugal transfer protein TraC, partial [Mariprofundaceae bacterium]|nr:conjugal transfer protein TraC [Mariprofundaceae bacterium]
MIYNIANLINPEAIDSVESPIRFSSILPYMAYDHDHIFQNEDGYGFVLESTPQTGADMEMTRILTSLLTLGWPADTGIQVHMYASPNVRNQLASWAGCRQGEKSETNRMDGVFRTLVRRRVGFILSGTKESLFKSMPFLVRDFRVFLSFTLPGMMSDKERTGLIELRRGVEAVLNGAHLPSCRVNAESFITLMAEMLNQESYDEKLKYDSGKFIRNQIINYDTTIDIEADHLLINEQTEVRMMSVKNYPEEFPLWSMDGLIGDVLQFNLQHRCPFWFTLGIHLPDLESAKAGAQMKAARSTHD